MWAGQTGVKFPAKARNCSLHQNLQDGSGSHPAFFSEYKRFFLHIPLLLTFRKSGAIPLLPPLGLRGLF